MPNIMGKISSTNSLSWNVNPTVSGAIGKATAATICANASGINVTCAKEYTFNAHNSNSTYQDGGKVKPDTIYSNFIIKY